MEQQLTVYVIDDDDEVVRESVAALVHSMGGRCLRFSSAEEFLQRYDPNGPGCVIADVRRPGVIGLELQQELIDSGIEIPVIVMTAFANTRTTVDAMKRGAIGVLEKPCRDDELFAAICDACDVDRKNRQSRKELQSTRTRLGNLTPDEREVLNQVVAGVPNKAIARALEVSIRTVESRRQRVFQKLQAASVAELVRIVLAADEGSQEHPSAVRAHGLRPAGFGSESQSA